MLNDATGFRRIYLATGYTDLRKGIDGLASIVPNRLRDGYRHVVSHFSSNSHI